MNYILLTFWTRNYEQLYATVYHILSKCEKLVVVFTTILIINDSESAS